MTDLSKEELLASKASTVDTDRLKFDGLRGDRSRHLDHAALTTALAGLPPAPKDEGTVDLLVARSADFGRILHPRVRLTAEGGMPQDRWAGDARYGADDQLATTRTDFARVIANGQPLELHGDNLFLTLDLSSENLPTGSRLSLGEALVEVTPQAHNGCKKWAQRFGLSPMQLNMAPSMRGVHLRGIYLRVIQDGEVAVGDPVRVLRR